MKFILKIKRNQSDEMIELKKSKLESGEHFISTKILVYKLSLYI
jgi:hypothetical protein